MKLKNFVKLPEKNNDTELTQYAVGFTRGSNKRLREIGEIEVSLDVRKIEEIIVKYLRGCGIIKEELEGDDMLKFTKESDWCELVADDLVTKFIDSFKEIIKSD